MVPKARDGGTKSCHLPGFPTYPKKSFTRTGFLAVIHSKLKNSFVHLKTAAGCNFSPCFHYRGLRRDSGRTTADKKLVGSCDSELAFGTVSSQLVPLVILGQAF